MHSRRTTRTVKRLQQAGLDPSDVEDLARHCLAEDLSEGPDLTSQAIIPPDTCGEGSFIVRRAGTVAGLIVMEALLDVFCSEGFTCHLHVHDGDHVEPGQGLATVHGRLRSLLLAERSVLNLLSHLSGIATSTRTRVDTLAGTGTTVRDTRKTTPGLQSLEKYAVRCGGGVNHRMSLSDSALIKDNHVAAAGSISRPQKLARRPSGDRS